MIEYSTLQSKANDIFYEWEISQGKSFTDDDRLLFIEGWIQGYLFLNNVEVA